MCYCLSALHCTWPDTWSCCPVLCCTVQIDLTDDFVVLALFGDGAWEDAMQRLTARDDAGNLVDVVLTQEAFRDFISVME